MCFSYFDNSPTAWKNHQTSSGWASPWISTASTFKRRKPQHGPLPVMRARLWFQSVPNRVCLNLGIPGICTLLIHELVAGWWLANGFRVKHHIFWQTHVTSFHPASRRRAAEKPGWTVYTQVLFHGSQFSTSAAKHDPTFKKPSWEQGQCLAFEALWKSHPWTWRHGHSEGRKMEVITWHG